MKNLPIIIVVVIIAAGAYLYFSGQKPSDTPATAPVATDIAKPVTENFIADKTVDIKGLNYAFDVKEIKVKLNDKVKINFTNTEGFHDFKIDEYNVATKQIKAGETESVEFVADKAGTFEYYCSVGQHRANGMFGKIIVE
jgi:nitrite reductase (NO-forming)